MGGLDQISRSIPSVSNLLEQANALDDSAKISLLITTVADLIRKMDELVAHSDDVSEKWNKGRLQLREFTGAPVLDDLAVKEMAYRTNGDFYVKESTTTISVFTRASTIVA